MIEINSTHPLFPEFPPVSTADWEAKINTDLKGADYNKKLIWNTTEGIAVKPYYRAEDIEKLNYLDVAPGEFPFVRGHKTSNDWDVRQDIDEPKPDKANRIALDAISRGVTAIGFNAKDIENADDIKALLSGIDLNKISVHFVSASSYPVLFNLFSEEISRQGLKAAAVKGSFNFDPLTYFLMYGKFYHSQEGDIDEAASLVKIVSEKLPAFRTITINGQYFHNAGASIVQELAFSLASANEYLSNLTEKGISVDTIAQQIQFVYAVGSNYFLEIAKLRAARLLWAKIVEQYNPKDIGSAKSRIHTVTSMWNKTVYDPHVNMLRNTTEAMSAAIGGCDSLTVTPFDSTYKKPDELSVRNARNIQLILKEESYLDKTADPSAGSYYIEALTDSIAEAVLKLFLEVEEKGGFVNAVQSGFIKEEIEKTCQKRDMDIAMRRQVFVGTNQYPNLLENMLDKIRPHSHPSQLSGLKQYRGAQTFEALRMSTEAYEKDGNKRPAVFLFTYGNPAMRKARAGFTTNFFGCIGYTIIDNPGFNTIEEGVKAALESKAEIIVLCSSDDEYAVFAKDTCAKLKVTGSAVRVIVAGNPAEIIEQLKKDGVDDFINIRTNVLEMLGKYQKMMGII